MLETLKKRIDDLPERVRTVIYYASIPAVMVFLSSFTTWLVLLAILVIGIYELRNTTSGPITINSLGFQVLSGAGILGMLAVLFTGSILLALVPVLAAVVWMIVGDLESDRDTSIGFIWITLAVFSAYEIRSGHHGLSRFLYALLIVAAADVGAYYGGRRFGRTKLAPHISPNKTREGAYCGVALAFLVSMVLMAFMDLGHRIDAWIFFVLPVLVAMAAIGGDLLESVFKRRHQAKDTGTIFPGHGGVLDRFDGTAAAFIIAAMFL